MNIYLGKCILGDIFCGHLKILLFYWVYFNKICIIVRILDHLSYYPFSA